MMALSTGRRASGFSLVELLMAMGITVGALGFALTAMDGLSTMREASSQLTDGNQSIRASLNLMTRDLLVAGRDIPVGGIPVPSGPGSVALVRPMPPGPPQTFPVGMLTLPAVSPGDAIGPAINGTQTDLVSVLMVDTEPVCGTATLNSLPLVGLAPDGSSANVDPAITVNCASNGIAPGDLIMFLGSNGTYAVQMVTTVNGQQLQFAPGDPMNLNQPMAGGGTILQIGPLVPGAVTASRVLMISYYIDSTSVPARPQLMRRVNLNPGRAIGIGMENFQISYDLVDGVANPVNVPTPVLPNSPNQIRKANVFLSGRSRVRATRSRQFLRTSLSTQVSLRGLSFVSRYN